MKTMSSESVMQDFDVALSNVLVVDIAWMKDNALKPGRLYDFSIGQQEVVGRIAAIEWQTDVDEVEGLGTERMRPDVAGRCRVSLAASLSAVSARPGFGCGDLTVIDRVSDVAVGVGQVHGPYHKDRESDEIASVR